MSSGAKQLVQIAKETVISTVPSPFSRQTLAFTDISLNQSVEKTESASITDNRLQQSSMITSAEYSGELNAEAQYGAYDDLMAAAAFNAWATNVLTFGGTTRQTFSVLLGYTDIANYHTFSGLHVNTFGIDIPESGLIGLTFGFMGTKRTPAAAAPAGTITPASTNPRMSNISVGDMLVDGVSVKGTACITAFSFNWDNSMQVQKCLGAGLEVGAIIEMSAKGTGSFTMAWSTKAAELYESQFTNATISLSIPITDTAGNKYVLNIPKVELTASLASGGKDDLLNTSFEYTVVDQAPTITRTPKT